MFRVVLAIEDKDLSQIYHFAVGKRVKIIECQPMTAEIKTNGQLKSTARDGGSQRLVLEGFRTNPAFTIDDVVKYLETKGYHGRSSAFWAVSQLVNKRYFKRTGKGQYSAPNSKAKGVGVQK